MYDSQTSLLCKKITIFYNNYISDIEPQKLNDGGVVVKNKPQILESSPQGCKHYTVNILCGAKVLGGIGVSSGNGRRGIIINRGSI